MTRTRRTRGPGRTDWLQLHGDAGAGLPELRAGYSVQFFVKAFRQGDPGSPASPATGSSRSRSAEPTARAELSRSARRHGLRSLDLAGFDSRQDREVRHGSDTRRDGRSALARRASRISWRPVAAGSASRSSPVRRTPPSRRSRGSRSSVGRSKRAGVRGRGRGSPTPTAGSGAIRRAVTTPPTRRAPTIDGATRQTYTITSADLGKRMRVRVTAKNAAGRRRRRRRRPSVVSDRRAATRRAARHRPSRVRRSSAQGSRARPARGWETSRSRTSTSGSGATGRATPAGRSPAGRRTRTPSPRPTSAGHCASASLRRTHGATVTRSRSRPTS